MHDKLQSQFFFWFFWWKDITIPLNLIELVFGKEYFAFLLSIFIIVKEKTIALLQIIVILTKYGGSLFSRGYFHKKDPKADIITCRYQKENLICSKLTIKTPWQHEWRCSDIFIASFEQISHLGSFCYWHR